MLYSGHITRMEGKPSARSSFAAVRGADAWLPSYRFRAL
jgi:hypothetical protein